MNKTFLKKYIQDKEQLLEAESLIGHIEQENSYESMAALAKILEAQDNDNLKEDIINLYKEAADKGKIEDAMLRLAKLYKDGKDYKLGIVKSFRYAYEAALLGNKEAEYILGRLFRYHHSVLALYWMKHAGNEGHAQAAMETAKMYDSGYGVSALDSPFKQDIADEYYQKAAELGNADAAKKITKMGKIIRRIKYNIK